jgi:hypothetical protein
MYSDCGNFGCVQGTSIAAVAAPDRPTTDAPVVEFSSPAAQSLTIDIANLDNVTKLSITGPPDKNMMGKVTNAIYSLDHRNIQGSRNEGVKDGTQKWVFMLQNDQEQQVRHDVALHLILLLIRLLFRMLYEQVNLGGDLICTRDLILLVICMH